MRIAYSPIYRYQLPPKHRFPMEKYTLLPEQLLYEGTIEEGAFFTAQPLSEAAILRTHTKEYWRKLKVGGLSRKEIRAIGFPMRPALIERGRVIAQGTLDCIGYAQQDGVALNVAGGTHHAFADRGEGFCVFNDIAIAANEWLSTSGASQPTDGPTDGRLRRPTRGPARILIVDLDVHQGNGTAKLFEHEPRVFTFSMHGARNYPARKEKSDLDIGLPDATGDEVYLQTLEHHLPGLLDGLQPELVFYLSGVDVLESDKLGRLALSLQGCRERDRFVLECCSARNIPVVVSMGGGYSERLATIIEAHANTFRMAAAVFR